MSDLGWMRTWRADAPQAKPLEDLNELYCRTKVAEAQAAEQGFAGTAAALASLAAELAEEPGVDHSLVWRLGRISEQHLFRAHRAARWTCADQDA